ncbi:MAG: 3-oxoacyl-ACP synthase III family protein [Myxococcota bacterium]
MQVLRRVGIAGTGMYVPPQVVTNADLEKLMDTSDEWIQQRTGIRQRHHVEDGTGPAHLALEASRQALESAGLGPEDLDAILVPSLSPHHEFPGTSAFLQDMLGISEIPAMDIRCQCTGFLYALQVGQLYVASGQYDRVLVCGAEVHSSGLDFSTRGRDVAVIFGDGAGALILEPSEDAERGILSVHLHAEGKHAKKLWVDAPGCVHKPRLTPRMLEQGLMYPKMDGRFVFKHAVRRMPEVIHEALAANKCSVGDVDFFIFHQANLRINEYVAGQLGIPPEKTYNNIDIYGNCSAASIPMCLDECARVGRIRPGHLVLLAGFGSGFTWGAALLRW